MSKEKQIEEMGKLCPFYEEGICNLLEDDKRVLCDFDCDMCGFAERLCNAGYRKQSEGEWVFEFTLDDDDFYHCSVCDRQEVINGLCKERSPAEHLPYRHCGAKMRKEDEGK